MIKKFTCLFFKVEGLNKFFLKNRIKVQYNIYYIMYRSIDYDAHKLLL
jgi:hypothetical protein